MTPVRNAPPVLVPAASAPAPCPAAAPAAPESSRPDPLAELARAAAAGDPVATRALLDAVTPPLLRTLRAVLGADHPDRDDVLQDALLGLLDALASFRGECTIAHFATRIAVRRAVRVRRRARFLARWLDRLRPAEQVETEDLAAGEAPAAGARRALLRTLLRELPDVQAEALALKVILGHSVEEVAAMTGVPPNTVRTRLQRAKDALRERVARDPRLAELAETAS